MGHRANLAIVTPDGYDLFFDRWCAPTFPYELCEGPSHAMEFIQRKKQVDPVNGWLDTIWAEGGVVIDPIKKRLLFYSDDLDCCANDRRVLFRRVQNAWEGWVIRWADNGIIDMAEYLGVAQEVVIAGVRICHTRGDK